MSEHRSIELRDFDGGTGQFEAVAVTYNVTDSYDTRFLPGCAADSLKRQLPKVHFGHNPQRPIGEVYDWRDRTDRLEIIGQLRPPSTSTFVRRAWEGMRSGVLTDFSIAFNRLRHRRAADGVTEFEAIDLGAVDLVLEGAVPGARLLATRDAAGMGAVARRLAYAERQARAGDHPAIGPSVSAAIREADEALDSLGAGSLSRGGSGS